MINAQGLLQTWTDRNANKNAIGFQFEVMDTLFIHIGLTNNEGPQIEPGTGWKPSIYAQAVSETPAGFWPQGQGFQVLHSLQGSNNGKFIPNGDTQEMAW